MIAVHFFLAGNWKKIASGLNNHKDQSPEDERDDNYSSSDVADIDIMVSSTISFDLWLISS